MPPASRSPVPSASLCTACGAREPGGNPEIALAQRNVAAYREAEAKGRGAVGVEGVLVDAAHVKMAEQTLARTALIGGR